MTRARPSTAAVIAAAALLGAGVAAYQITRPGLLFGTTADIAVYLGASVRLVHGALPYRDFVFVQPPGFVLLATPFAALSDLLGTRGALAVLRASTPLIAAASVVLVGVLTRTRGRAATLIACGVMALSPAELYALQDGMLEPVMIVLCLLGAVAAFPGGVLTDSRGRLLLAGAAFGLACAVKAPALIPLAVLVILCLPAARRRLLPFACGATLGFGIANLAFIVTAPGAWFDDVVAAQLARIPDAGRVPASTRLIALTGAPNLEIAIAVVCASAVVVAAAFALTRVRPGRFEMFALLSTVAVAAAQLVPAQYYPQYAAFLAPFAALLLGVSVQRLATRRPKLATRAFVAAAAALLLIDAVWTVHDRSTLDYAQTVDAIVPAGACALSDSPRYLLTTDRFVSNVPRCPLITDPFGTALRLRGAPAQAHATWLATFSRVDYVVTDKPIAAWYIQADREVLRYMQGNFSLVRSGGLLFYVRRAQ